MTIEEAANAVVKKFPGRIVTGYWIFGQDYVFNTRPFAAYKGITAPAQFVVTSTGEIYGTNPMRYDLDPAKMKKM